MPSKLHQMLVGLIARKMHEKGYEIVAFDGNEYLFGGQKLNVPPKIKRHRPDIVGFNFETKEVCIGEAKTREDLLSERTEEQLLDYSATKQLSTDRRVEVILGIPMAAEKDLIELLKRLNLSGKNFISYIWLPEELVENG